MVVHLWRNECTRVIADRFIEEPDIEKYNNLLYEITTRIFKDVELSNQEKIIFSE